MRVDMWKISHAENTKVFSDWREDLENLKEEFRERGFDFCRANGTYFCATKIRGPRFIFFGFDRSGKIGYKFAGGRSKNTKAKVFTEEEGIKAIDVVMEFIQILDKHGFILNE